jgi:hypothetical protein
VDDLSVEFTKLLLLQLHHAQKRCTLVLIGRTELKKIWMALLWAAADSGMLTSFNETASVPPRASLDEFEIVSYLKFSHCYW